MPRLIIILFCIATNIICFADYVDRGRPCDFQEHHDGPLDYIFIGIAVIILLVFLGYWIYDKISSHKEQISNALGTIFTGLLFFGGILLIGKCGESLHNSINSDKEKDINVVNTNNQTPSPNVANPANNSNVYQSVPSQYKPTIHYRTVEYYEKCYNCDGSGQVLCPRCKGTGSYRKTCSWCNGSGGHSRSRCLYCGGKGYNEDDVFNSGRHSCLSCNGTGYRENSCLRCGGTGYESELCDFDAVVGRNKHMVSCPACNGNGTIRRTKQEIYYE